MEAFIQQRGVTECPGMFSPEMRAHHQKTNQQEFEERSSRAKKIAAKRWGAFKEPVNL